MAFSLRFSLVIATFFVIAVICGTVTDAETGKGQAKRIAREKSIFNKRNKSRRGLISIDSDEYINFILKRRDFHSFVLFSMDSPKCPTCKQLKPEFEHVAAAFKKQQKELMPGEMVYFFYADYKRNERIFAPNPSLKHVPVVAYVPPGRRMKSQPANAAEARTKWMEPFPDKHIMPQQTIMGGAESVLDWVGEIAKKEDNLPSIERPKVEVNPWPARMNFLVMLLLGGVTIAALTWVLGGPKTTFLVSLGVIFWTYSGGYWNTHRHPQWSGDNGEWFVGWNGSQHVLEGIIIALLNIAAGFAIIALNTVVPKQKGATRKMMVASAAILFGFFTWWTVIKVYMKKNGGYLVMGRA